MKKRLFGLFDWVATGIVGGTVLFSFCLFISMHIPALGALLINALLTVGWGIMVACLASLGWLQMRVDAGRCVLNVTWL